MNDVMQHRFPVIVRPSAWSVQGPQQRRKAPRRRAPSRGGRASPVKRTLFHAPSFSAGVIMGALVVLGAAYLPELSSSETTAGPPPAAGAPENRPTLTFEFDDLLRNGQVTADPGPYVSEPEPAGGDAQEEIVLQAASFRSRDDAERLRAALLLLDLPATTSAISLDNGAWHRVTVGPFQSRVKAERALTRLRERDIAAIWTTRARR